MITTLALGALLLAAGDRPPVARPRTPPRVKQAPKAPPLPLEEPEDPEPSDPPDEPALAPPTEPSSPNDPEPRDDKPFGDATDEEVGYAIIGGSCCCIVVFGALGLLIYFLVRKKPAATSVPAPVAEAPSAPSSSFHLSVLAVGLQASAREAVAQQLPLTDPATAGERTQLIRTLSQALLANAGAWSHFGYGERLDLFDEASAARSYQLAVDDFKKRSELGSMSGEAAVVVATLVLCTRRQLRGVSSLSDREQIRTLLEERSGLLESELMGGLLVWSPPLGASEVIVRFPEMHALR